MNFSGITSDLLRGVTRIITHADCPDGIASAMILHDALPTAAIEFIQYKTPEWRDLAATPGMLFCDMTPPPERAQEFVAAGAIVLDHHKGAEDIVAAFGERGVFADEVKDPGVSGARLAASVWSQRVGDTRYSGEWASVMRFARLAGIRDTWQRAHPLWSEACAQAELIMFRGAERMLRQRRAFLTDSETELASLLSDVRLQAARNIAQHNLYRLGGWRIFNDGKGIVSDVAEAVRELDPEATGVCGFHYAVQSDGNMSLVFSLRSCGADILCIAKANGGGGHTGAAGFSVPATPYSPLEAFERCLRCAS